MESILHSLLPALERNVLAICTNPDRRRLSRSVPDVPRESIVVLGDSVEHDIAGGTALGCQTVLVRTGVG